MEKKDFFKIVPVKQVKQGSCIPGRQLGNGGFGDVVACKHGNYVMKLSRATKAIGEETEKVDELVGEYEYIDYCVPGDVEKYFSVAKMYPVMKNQNTMCYDKTVLVMEKMTGDLYGMYNDFIKGGQKTSWKNIEFVNALAPKLDAMLTYLHDTVGYCHNDIKPANIGYVDGASGGNINVDVRLLDMGSSVKMKKNEKPYMMGMDSRLHGGTFVYMTKNTLEEIQDSRNRDKWAMGCTLYELIAGVPMNSGFNSTIELSYFKILSNYNDALLKYMLGSSDDDIGIEFISDTMRIARQQFLAALSGTIYEQDLTKRIYNYMKPSLKVAVIQKSLLARGGGSSRFRKGMLRISGGNVCRDPTLEDGVITEKGHDGRLEIIRVTDINRYREYLNKINCVDPATISRGGPVQDGGNNKPTRKIITEKQYERAKTDGKKRVARYRLKDGSYVHYMYNENARRKSNKI